MKSELQSQQYSLTEKLIFNTFLDILAKKDFKKITVKEVCEAADISRGTFYLHFLDISDLMDKINLWYYSQAVEFYQMEFDSFGRKTDEEQFRKGVKGHLELLASWPQYAIAVLGKGLCPGAIEGMKAVSIQQHMQWLETNEITEDLEPYEYDFVSKAAGVQGIMQKWCADGLHVPVDRVVDYIIKFLE